MVLDGLRGYLELANGLTDVTRERARVAAKTLVAQGEASVGAVLPGSLKAQVGSLTEDLIATSKANRALLLGLVGAEVERATARFGLAMSGELDAAQRRAQRLEQRVADLESELRAALADRAPAAGAAPAGSVPVKKAAVKKAAVKKAAVKKAAVKKAAVRKSPAKKTT
jgi:polyhydroxyalkanoate synthesis regulator phasin